MLFLYSLTFNRCSRIKIDFGFETEYLCYQIQFIYKFNLNSKKDQHNLNVIVVSKLNYSKSMKNILDDNEFAEVSYETDLKLGKIIWKKKPTFEAYQKAFLTLVEHSKEKQVVESVMTDTRNQGVVSPENRKWLVGECLPVAVKVGLKQIAVIFDGGVFKQYYLNMILKVINKYGAPMKLFKNEEDALNWIKSFS